MKVKDFRRKIRKCGEGKNRKIWREVGDSIPVPSLMRKPEVLPKHWQNWKIEQSGGKIYKKYSTKTSYNHYLTISEQSIEVQSGKIHEI